MTVRFILSSLLCLVAVPAIADTVSRVERHYEYDVTAIDELRIDASVGTIRIEPSETGLLTIELTLKAEQRGSWIPFAGRERDVSGMELTERRRGRQLLLGFDENRVSSDWVVRLPALTDLRVDLGVGVVEGELPDMPARIDVGVGSVDLLVSGASTGEIELDAGVGDTRIRGASGTDSRRALVGSASTGYGDGDHRIRIDVGVGDVSLELRNGD